MPNGSGVLFYMPPEHIREGFSLKRGGMRAKGSTLKILAKIYVPLLSLFVQRFRQSTSPGLAQKMYCCRCICLLASIVLTLQFDTIVDLYVSLRDWI